MNVFCVIMAEKKEMLTVKFIGEIVK